MKRIFLFLALALLAVSADAQGRYYYDSSHKYGFFSNWYISPFAQASFLNGKTAVGAGGMALKQLDDHVRFRMEASVNGTSSIGCTCLPKAAQWSIPRWHRKPVLQPRAVSA